MDDPPPEHEDSVGVCQSDLTVEEIRVWLSDDLLEWPPYDADRVIVHELLHALVNRVVDHDENLRAFVTPAQFETYREGRLGDEEQLVNRLAHALVATERGEWPIYGTHRQRR